MELKRMTWLPSTSARWSFNRTTMELKQTTEALPLPAPAPFNRTTMELKLVFFNVAVYFMALLIEPLWNWNKTSKKRDDLGGELLIEPLWNWNDPALAKQPCSYLSFNRTTMELKHATELTFMLSGQPFNRTTMELKPSRMRSCRACAFNF